VPTTSAPTTGSTPSLAPIPQNEIQTAYGICSLRTACDDVSQNTYCCNYVLNTAEQVSQKQLFLLVKTVRDLNIASMVSDYFFVLVALGILLSACLRKALRSNNYSFVDDSSSWFDKIKPALLCVTVVGCLVDVGITFTIVGVISQNDMIDAIQQLYDNRCYSEASYQTLLELKGQLETVLILDAVEGALDVLSLLLLFGGFAMRCGFDFAGCANFAEAIHSFMFCVFDVAIISVNVFLFVLPSYNLFQDTFDNPDFQCLSVVALFGDVAAE